MEVFLLDGTSKAKAEELITQIKAQPGVTDAAYRSKDEALEIMKERWGESGYLLDSLGKNPLPGLNPDQRGLTGERGEYCSLCG